MGLAPKLTLLSLTLILMLGAAVQPAWAATIPPPEPFGAWIDSVEPWSLGERAGLRAGDRVVAWRRAASFPAAPIPGGGPIATPFDLEQALREEAPRGAVELTAWRDGRPRSFVLVAGASPEAVGVRSRPAPRDEPDAALWRLRERARALEEARRFDEADAAFGEAAQAFVLWGRPREAAEVAADWAQSLDRRRRWDAAVARLTQAERWLASGGEGSLTLARVLYDRGDALKHRDDYPGARRDHGKALALRSAAAPGSLDQAASFAVLGRIADESGLGDPFPLFEQAESIYRRLDPGSLAHGLVIDCAAHARWLDDVAGTERGYREALEIARRRAPGGFLETRELFHLGVLRARQNDILGARELLTRAQEVLSRLPEDFLSQSLQARLLGELGRLAVTEGDAAAGYELARESLALQHRVQPDSIGVAVALADVAYAAYRLRRYTEAADYLRETIGLRERLTPANPAVARDLLLLAMAQAMLGDLVQARAILGRARLLLAAHPADVSSHIWLSLAEGLVAGRSGKVEEAIAWNRQVLAQMQALGSQELGLVDALAILAYWERAGGRKEDFFRHACESASLLEQLSLKLTPDAPARLRVADAYSRAFALCAEALLAAGRPAEAFGKIEAGRARSLAALLAEREMKRQTVPRSLTLEEARRALDPGTVLLEYAVGDFTTLLFVVRAPGLPGKPVEAHRLPWGSAELGGKVAAFRDLVSTPLSELSEIRMRSRELYRVLVAPAAAAVAAADRVVIAPDGPLNGLPFAALEDAAGRPLIAAKPLHGVVSASVYAELKEKRRPLPEPEKLRIAAFGDPDYGPAAAETRISPAEPLPAGVDLRRSALVREGFNLDALPATRQEVEAIGALFPGTASFVGEAATEGRARQLDRGIDIVHFAVHALVNTLEPLRSSLVLSLRGGASAAEDGFLDVSEIVTGLRLDASLVVLSGCETALGRPLEGEGLVGLTRAFHLAGARSVLASLWEIGDRDTAALMRRFYQALRAGLPKDAALRQAQLETLGDPATAHPWSWAGFVLAGDPG